MEKDPGAETISSADDEGRAGSQLLLRLRRHPRFAVTAAAGFILIVGVGLHTATAQHGPSGPSRADLTAEAVTNAQAAGKDRGATTPSGFEDNPDFADGYCGLGWSKLLREWSYDQGPPPSAYQGTHEAYIQACLDAAAHP